MPNIVLPPDYKPSSDEEYMSELQLEYFRQKLIAWKEELLKESGETIDDLKEGMILTGTVRNVIDFGAFVDIGVKNDGLVHISEMSDKYIKNPMDIVSVGDIIKVRVIKIDMEKKKVGLSMKECN